MDLPKCRICGERHRLGGCPSMQTKSARSSEVEPRSHKPRVAGSKPAGSTKSKKKGKTNAKTAASANRKKNKVRNANLKRRSKGPPRPELSGNGAAQPLKKMGTSRDLSASPGDV